MSTEIIPRNRFTDLRQLPIAFKLEGFKVTILGWGFYEPEWWRNYLHEHSFFEVCYVWHGYGVFRINHKEYPVREGMVFVAKPGEPHEIISSEDDPMGIYFWSYTLVPNADRLTQNDTNMLLQAFLASEAWVSSVPEMQQILNRLTEEIVTRQAGYSHMIEILIAQLLLNTARAVSTVKYVSKNDIPTEHDPTTLLVSDIVRYIQDNYTRPITLRDIAAQVHLSNRHTNRLFHRVMGVSVHTYLTQFRLKVASQLLLDQELSITETAYACGYRDVRYFITLFKQHSGITPAVFRKQGGTRFLNPS